MGYITNELSDLISNFDTVTNHIIAKKAKKE